MKNLIFAAVLSVTLAAGGLDTDTGKFFNQGVGPDTVKLPADKIYPQGRLFPFTFYSTGGGSMEKRGKLLPDAEREADTQEIVRGGVTMIGPQYELNDQAAATARKYGVKAVYTVHPVIDGKVLAEDIPVPKDPRTAGVVYLRPHRSTMRVREFKITGPAAGVLPKSLETPIHGRTCALGGDFHCRWFLVNMAKAFAPIAAAFKGAFSTPPEIDTCAPIYFMILILCSIFIIN